MKLLEALKSVLPGESNLFAAQLLREDIARLEKLGALAQAHADGEAFHREAMLLGWTQGDLRTFELDPELSVLLGLLHTAARGGEDNLNRIGPAWDAFQQKRMDVLVGCLSRVPMR